MAVEIEREKREGPADLCGAGTLGLPIAEQAGRTIVVNAPDVAMLSGRPDHMSDVVSNLIDNALVHGAGTVEVTVAIADDDAVIAGAGPDHPVHPFLPESAYLKALLLQLD